MTSDDHVREWGPQRAAIDEDLARDPHRVEHRAVATSILAERAAAYARASDRGMDLTVESELSPTILSGSYRGHRFWYFECQGDWQLHLHDAGGPVIAESGTIGLADVVDLICDRLARYDCPAADGTDRHASERLEVLRLLLDEFQMEHGPFTASELTEAMRRLGLGSAVGSDDEWM